MLPSEALRADMTELQRTSLQTLQTRQLQLLLAEQGGAEAGSLPSLYPGPTPPLPAPAGVPRPPARPWTRQVDNTGGLKTVTLQIINYHYFQTRFQSSLRSHL